MSFRYFITLVFRRILLRALFFFAFGWLLGSLVGFLQSTEGSLRARIEQHQEPTSGTCERCKRPWRFVRDHSTWFYKREDLKPGQAAPAWAGPMVAVGVGVLCEKCWSALTPWQRLPFYRQLWYRWGERDGDEWAHVEKAVLAGN